MIVWLIGLSGVGKTTVGKKLYEMIKEKHANTVFLDGDLLRDVWADQLGHTLEARRKNAERISNLCKMLDQQGIHVVASVLSLFPDWQSWNRAQFNDYYEVFLNGSLDLVVARDNKNIYARALRGELENVVGVDIDMPSPPNADLVLNDSDLEKSPTELARIIFEKLDV